MPAESHIQELLPAYVLGCLEPDDQALVARHLAECPNCEAELQDYQAVLDQLALAVPEAAPSPALKGRLLSRLVRPAPASGRTAGPWWQSLAGYLRQTAPVWAAAGLVLILLLAASNFWLWQQVRRLEATAAPLRTVALSGTEAAPVATGLIVVSVDGHHGTLVVDRLPPLDPNRQYQLWLIRDEQRTSGGVFSVSKEGYGAEWISAPEPLSSYAAFGISVEPAGGSPGPTGPRVLGGAFQ